ncbi:MAG: transcription termination factor Rho [Phycisphaerae bacterium]|nr:MAG: transcription termination factor Rho [Planctomycetia bacterium]RIK67985.1 MAG: transcription termination factor Rho [Planctomycetota bacterium]GJQ27091.1 MAG: transcription termination factor Rho [Phycisphaerae bacterium]
MQPNEQVVEGTLEIAGNGPGYLRDPKRNYTVSPNDPQVPRDLIQRFKLRGGEALTATANRGRKGNGPLTVSFIKEICGQHPGAWAKVLPFEELPVVHPTEILKFETPGGPMSTRIVDLLAPIGKGQRGLIVAPPRTGKTVLLRQMAEGITANHPEIFLMMLLIDERPEEVTEMKRAVVKAPGGWQHGAPEVVYSSNDHDAKSHGRIAKLMIEKAKRHLEMGEDVLILLDSLTRLGRAFNTLVGNSGRTMTGGLDIRALELPKQMFGSARKIENGGSLTIIASVLVETGSRMDDFIFQEFKGTGNMELVLSRELANLRIWPAMNLSESGTRKEELLLGAEGYEKMSRVRRRLLSQTPQRQMEGMIDELKKFETNEVFLKNLA